MALSIPEAKEKRMEQLTNSSPTAGATQQDMVPIPEASDADLMAFLENHSQQADVSDDQSAEPEGEEQQAEVTPPPVAEKPAVEEQQEPEKVEDSSPSPKTQEPTTEQRLDAMRRQMEGLELLVQRRTSEIAQLRQKIEQQIKPERDKLEANEFENPLQALKLAESVREKERQIEALDQHETEIKRVAESQKIVAPHLEDVSVDEMAECLSRDGVPLEMVTEFKRSPYTLTEATTVIQLAKRAKAERFAKQLYQAALKLQEENKQLREKPKAVLSKVEKALRTTPTVNGASGGGLPSTHDSSLSTSEMSDREIEEFLKTKR